MSPLLDRLGGFGLMLLTLGWIVSAPLGMIYWAAKGNLLAVVLSLIFPGFGIVTTAWAVLS